MRKYYIIVLFLMIFIPGIQVFTISDEQVEEIEQLEKRKLTEWTAFNPVWKGMFNQIKDYVDDRFTFRLAISKLYTQLQIRLYGKSPNNRVVIGQDGWLFINEINSCEYVKGLKLMDPAFLEAYRQTIVERAEWLALHGIKYYIAIPPLKHHIYAHKLPMKYLQYEDTCQLLATYEQLNQHPNITVIFLEEELKKHNNEHIYYKTDTHWNLKGAYYAYTKIYDQLKTDGYIENPMIKYDDVTVDSNNSYEGDLNSFMQDHSFFSYTYTTAKEVRGQKYEKVDLPQHLNIPGVEGEKVLYKNEQESTKVFIQRDSFTKSLIPFLRGHFNSMFCNWTHKFYPEMVLSYQPDIYLHIQFERMVMIFDEEHIQNPPILKQEILHTKAIE